MITILGLAAGLTMLSMNDSALADGFLKVDGTGLTLDGKPYTALRRSGC